jgi:hypothetical protein
LKPVFLLEKEESSGLGHWGVKSYEIDEAAYALDAAFERVHGAHYEDLMDDRNALRYEQVHELLANPKTLAAAVAVLTESQGRDLAAWDEVGRLAFAGVVVRHAELGLPVPEPWRKQAVSWLENEEIEWHEETARRLRKQKELNMLNGAATGESS